MKKSLQLLQSFDNQLPLPFFIDEIYQDHYTILLNLDDKEKYGNKVKNYIKEEIKQSKIYSRCHWYFASKADEKKHKRY